MVGRRPGAGAYAPHNRIKIADEPDFTVRVFEYKKPGHGNSHAGSVETQLCKTTESQVNIDLLAGNSPVIASELEASRLKGNDTSLNLHENTLISTRAMEIWFRFLHKN